MNKRSNIQAFAIASSDKLKVAIDGAMYMTGALFQDESKVEEYLPIKYVDGQVWLKQPSGEWRSVEGGLVASDSTFGYLDGSPDSQYYSQRLIFANGTGHYVYFEYMLKVKDGIPSFESRTIRFGCREALLYSLPYILGGITQSIQKLFDEAVIGCLPLGEPWQDWFEYWDETHMPYGCAQDFDDIPY